MANNSNFLDKAVDGIFGNSNKHIHGVKPKQSNNAKSAKILENESKLALTVILVELAGSDQNFDLQEYDAICMGLKRVFNIDRQEVQNLVNQANTVLAGLRGTTGFAEKLAKNLDADQKKVIIEVIDDLINTDGKVDGFEIYLKQKFIRIIGL